jgi:hypothetical protein
MHLCGGSSSSVTGIVHLAPLPEPYSAEARAAPAARSSDRRWSCRGPASCQCAATTRISRRRQRNPCPTAPLGPAS